MKKSILAATMLAVAAGSAHAADIRNDRYTTGTLTPSWQDPWPNGVPDGYGVFETSTDADWFRVDLIGGRDYAFIDGPIGNGDNGPGDVANTVVIKDVAGHRVPTGPCTFGDDVCGAEFRVARTGTYFLRISVVQPVVFYDRTPVAPPYGYSVQVGPDCRGDRTTTCSIKPGTRRGGRSAWGNDVDWFRAPLVDGRRYTVTLSCGSIGAIMAIAPDGTTELGKVSSETTGGSVSLTFKARKTAAHFIRANCADDDGDGGRYTLSMK